MTPSAPDPPRLDALWADRHDASVFQKFEQALQAALRDNGGSAELLWRAARSAHFQAMQAGEAGDSKRAGQLFEEGASVAERAERLEPQNVGALFWAASCGLEAARARGPLAALRTLPGARRTLERAAARQPAFHYAGPSRVLGRMAHQTPRLLGGSVSRAIQLYRDSLRLAPAHPTTMLYLAEALLDTGKRDEARDLLEQIIAAPEFADWRWEQERDRTRARSILAAL